MEEVNNNDISLIERYFELDLTEKELVTFNQRLQVDQVFATQVNQYQSSINLVYQQFGSKDQQQRSDKWSKLLDNNTKDTSSKINTRWIAGIAASITILFSVWFYSNQTKHNNLEALAQKAWAKNIGFADYQTRNQAENYPKQKVLEAFKFYNNNEYTNAINSLNGYNSSLAYYEDALLIKALSIYKLGNQSAAIETLDSLVSVSSGRLKKEALWYKGLILLDLKDITAAKNYLIIPDDTSSEIQLKEFPN